MQSIHPLPTCSTRGSFCSERVGWNFGICNEGLERMLVVLVGRRSRHVDCLNSVVWEQVFSLLTMLVTYKFFDL